MGMVSRLSCLLLLAVAGRAAAGVDGLWQQVSDDGRVNALVRIETIAGQTQATIVKGYPAPGAALDPDARCVKCEGDLRDQPLIGLRFLWGLKGGSHEWRDGQIVDPATGSLYRANASLSQDESSLTVRGYVGWALFGRSQVWRRAPDPSAH